MDENAGMTRCVLVEDLETIRKHLSAMESFYIVHFRDVVFDPELIATGKRVFGWRNDD